MKVLYLAEDYIGTKVHHNLCSRMTSLHPDAEMTVYCYARSIGSELDNSKSLGDVKYKAVISAFTGNLKRFKFDYSYRNRYKMKDLTEKLEVSSFDMVHAGTLFSEGSIALRIKEQYGIPYIVAVRGTDLNVFIKFAFHLWPLGRKILKNAEKVIFISSHLQSDTEKSLFATGIRKTIKSKANVIYNAIDDFWHKNIGLKREVEKSRNILYIGRFDSNKNVETLQKAVLTLVEKYPGIKLTLVGGKGDRQEQVLEICKQHPDVFDFKGPIYDKDVLCQVMRGNNIFAMISHSETFGLVYVEAMSQGLPVLYTKGQGIDGIFEDKIGEGVNSHDVNSVVEGLTKMLDNYAEYKPISNLGEFSWDYAVEEYYKMFTKICE